MSDVFACGDVQPVQEQAFEASVETFILSELVVLNTACTATRLVRTHRTIARNGMDDVILQFCRSGSYRFETDNRVTDVGSGDVIVFDLSRPVAISASRVEALSLLISRRFLAELAPQIDDLHGQILPATALRRLLVEQISALVEVAPRLTMSEAGAASNIMIRLAAACLAQLPWRQVDSRGGSVTLAAIKTSIEQQLDRPGLGPDDLMQQFAVSRSTLYRLFEPVGGVRRYIAERRLRRAFQLISDPNLPATRISQIAYDMGFSSPTTFGLAFRQLFGITPREARSISKQRGSADRSSWVIPDTLRRFVQPL